LSVCALYLCVWIRYSMANPRKRSHHCNSNPKEIKQEEACKERSQSELTCFFLQDNPFILSGFREYTEKSFLECSKSIFHVHNDTMNVWTHLIPALWHMYCIYYAFVTFAQAHTTDKYVFFFFHFCSAFCFLASSAYHIFRSHSLLMYKTFLLLDVGGIAFQIFGSVFLISYFEMACYPIWRNVWIALVIVLFSLSIILMPYLLRHRLYNTRTFLLVTFALSGFMAHMHRASFSGFVWTASDLFTLQNLTLCYLCSGIGLVIRRTKVPELFVPGYFDVWFGSHQIFHVLVSMGPWYLTKGYLRYLSDDNSYCS